MEIILKQDLEGLGFKDDIITVKNGYGRNFLIPSGYAILATTSAKKVLAENIKQRAFKEKKVIEDAKKVAEALKELELKISVKVSSGDKLFGSVNNSDLSTELEKLGQTIDKKFISVAGGSVKRLGKYNAQVRLHRDLSVEMPFEIIAEKV